MTRTGLLIGCWIFLCVVEGCSSTRVLRHPPSGGGLPVASRFGPLTAERQRLVDANCLGGLPQESVEAVGATELVVRRGYVLEHSSRDKIPLWVCEGVGVAQLVGHEKRSNRFVADPELVGAKSTPADYRASGYDRGHQAPAGNQTVDRVLKDETFYMSNMAPQRPSLNQGIWKLLEDKSRRWVARYGHAYQWTGPIRCEPLRLAAAVAAVNGAGGAGVAGGAGSVGDRQAAASGGSCQPQFIGPNNVAVPVFFYKIIVVQDQGAWRAIAFVLPNGDFKRPYRLNAYLTSIAVIEAETGVTFMPGLGARERRALVSGVSRMWP